MRFRSVLLPLAGLLLVFGALLAACGGDNKDKDNNGGNGDNATAAMTEPADGAAPTEEDTGGGGDGSATLTIGDETWEFTGYYCAFGPEETRNDRVSFSSGAFGESAEGVRLQLDVTIQDTDEQGRYEGEGTIHSVSLDDVEDFENPSVAWNAVSGIVGESAYYIQIDGKSIHAEAAFDDGTTDAIESTPGTFDGSCP